MKTLRQTSRSANEVQYADPDQRQDTLTIRSSVQPKKAGSMTVYNAKSSLGLLRVATLAAPEGCVDNCAPVNQEKLAGSVNLSGSTASKADVIALWADLKAATDLVIADLSAGFIPQSTEFTAV